jgi:hypothetical protein
MLRGRESENGAQPSGERRVLIPGRCHCGNISFVLTWEPAPVEIPARACDCSFCARHGGVWTSFPGGALRVSERDQALVSRYRFGTETADFQVCAGCGVVPLVTSEIEGQLYAVVNVKTFDGIDPALLRPVSSHVEGETRAARLARRQRNWIGRVEFVAVKPEPADRSGGGGY